MLLLGAIVLAATASLGSIAYLSSRAIIEDGVVREVGITACSSEDCGAGL